jgi:hypothetical protein
MNALELVHKWLEQEGHKIEAKYAEFWTATNATHVKQLREHLTRLTAYTPHHNMDVTITKSVKKECVEIWVGGDHNAGRQQIIKATYFKHISFLGWLINLYDPESLPRISEIVRDPYIKAGDYVIKNKYGQSGRIK